MSTSGAVTRVDGAWMQTGVLTFNRALAAQNRVWEIITEAPALTIPRAGIWQVNFQARGVAQLPANGGTATVACGVTAGLYKNGTLIPGTEVMAVYTHCTPGDQGVHVQSTGSRQFMHRFAAGDTVQLAAMRLSVDGNAHVSSNSDGRSYVTAHWVAPEDDTAS